MPAVRISRSLEIGYFTLANSTCSDLVKDGVKKSRLGELRKMLCLLRRLGAKKYETSSWQICGVRLYSRSCRQSASRFQFIPNKALVPLLRLPWTLQTSDNPGASRYIDVCFSNIKACYADFFQGDDFPLDSMLKGDLGPVMEWKGRHEPDVIVPMFDKVEKISCQCRMWESWQISDSQCRFDQDLILIYLNYKLAWVLVTFLPISRSWQSRYTWS